MLPGIKAIDFGDRDVEVGAQPVFQALHDVALLFEGMRILNVNV
jgi:hypothetical protein